MPLWTWSELARLGNSSAEVGPDITGVSIDSRAAKKGDLFVALSGDPGPRFNSSVENPRDGHEFIDSAAANGASAVMLSDRASAANLPFVEVADTLDGLWALGHAARQRCNGKIVAITGSAGKTTLRSWLMQVLSSQLNLHGSTASLNNHWGVPLSLSRMPRDSELGVFEVGTNHRGEIAPLSQLVQPHIAILLNVLPAHIGNFESLASLEDEKRSISAGLVDGGCCILPEHLANGEAGQITFGFSSTADAYCEYETRNGGCLVNAVIQGESMQYHLPFAGEHRVLTSLALMLVARQLDVNLESVCAEMSSITVPQGRGDEVRIGDITVIDDSYNANPISMGYALAALKLKPGRRIAILGEIMELGDSGPGYHQEISQQFENLDLVVTVGHGFSNCSSHRHFSSVNDIDLSALVSSFEAGDSILLKASNKVFWQKGFAKKLCEAISDMSNKKNPTKKSG